MPRTYTGYFRVRWTDCDAAGHVSRAAFVRYMQEVGFEAGSDAGYGLEYWTGAGVGWLARRSRVDYLQPARYGDELEVTTYLTSFSRIRAQRNYDVVRAGDGAPVARAAIDWVLFDRKTGAPARLSAEIMRVFRPEGPDPEPGTPLDSTRLPDVPPPNAYHSTRRVHYEDMDEYQHVNNAVYLNYLEQATLDANASIGLDMPRLMELNGMFVVRQHDLEYLHAATYGDMLDIVTWIGEVSNDSVLRHTTMRDQGSTLALRAQTRWLWIDSKTREAAAIPSALRGALAQQQVMSDE